MQEKKENIVVYEFDPASPPPLTEEQKARLDALAKMPDSAIDYSDIPELANFSGFRRVSPLSSFVRIDGDILEWVETLEDDRQALVNEILREHMLVATANDSWPGKGGWTWPIWIK